MADIGSAERQASEQDLTGIQAAWWAWCIPAVSLLLFSFGLPILCMGANSLLKFAGPGQASGPISLENFIEFFSETYNLRVLLNTFILGIAVVSFLCFWDIRLLISSPARHRDGAES
jgi:ABC-type spermidine/putrescine transport system permease subunit I